MFHPINIEGSGWTQIVDASPRGTGYLFFFSSPSRLGCDSLTPTKWMVLGVYIHEQFQDQHQHSLDYLLHLHAFGGCPLIHPFPWACCDPVLILYGLDPFVLSDTAAYFMDCLCLYASWSTSHWPPGAQGGMNLLPFDLWKSDSFYGVVLLLGYRLA